MLPMERDEIVARLNRFVFGSIGPVAGILSDPYTDDGVVFVMSSGEEILAFLTDDGGEELYIDFVTCAREIVVPKDVVLGKPN